MGQVTVAVNDRTYTVGCDDGEEAHVEYLAEYVDKRVRELVSSVGQVGEPRLLLLAALLIADDLSGAYDKLESINDTGGSGAAAAETGGNGAVVDALARRLEAVADQLENA